MVSAWPTAGGFGGYFTNGTTYTAPNAPAARSNESACGRTGSVARIDDAEQHGEQRAHGETENQHTESQPGARLHAAGEQLGAVLVHAVGILGVGAAVFKSDCAANDGLGAQAGEDERQHRADGTRQKTAPDQAFLHETRSVAGEAE